MTRLLKDIISTILIFVLTSDTWLYRLAKYPTDLWSKTGVALVHVTKSNLPNWDPSNWNKIAFDPLRSIGPKASSPCHCGRSIVESKNTIWRRWICGFSCKLSKALINTQRSIYYSVTNDRLCLYHCSEKSHELFSSHSHWFSTSQPRQCIDNRSRN